MSLSDEDDDDVSEYIRQFLEDITPAIQDVDSLDAVEEKLTHLEETDEEFHKYPYIKHLRRRIDTALTGLIDDEIDQNKSHDMDSGSEETLVNRITGMLLKSPPYLNLLKSLKVETKAAVDSLIRSFQDDLIQRARKENARLFEAGGRRSPKQSALSFTDDSSLGSSFNQGAFAFVSQERFIEMVQNMDVSKPISVRRAALNNLYQMPPSEAQACEYWNVLRHALGDGLSDPDEELSEKCLKYYARMLAAPHPILTSDIYGSLVEHIASYFGARKGMLIPVEDGIDMTDMAIVKLIRKFSLMCQFQLEVSTYWVRYPDRFMDNIIESTLSLLAVNPSIPLSNTENITPLHYLALIDTRANWFKKWMHGNYSRSVVLSQLSKHRFLIENTVRWCIRLQMCRQRKPDPLDDVTGNMKWTNISSNTHQYYSKPQIEYCFVVHSLCVVGRLLQYKAGRRFFPIKLKELPDPVSVTSFLVSVINLVVEPTPAHTANVNSKVAGYDAALLVTEMLKKLTESESACTECLCKDAVTNALLEPVRFLLSSTESDSYESHKISEMTLLHIADVLSSLAAVESGRSHLLYGEGKTSFTINLSAPIHTIAKFAVKCLNGARFEPALQNSVVAAYVYICRQLYTTCEGLFILTSYHLHTAITNAWEESTQAADLSSTPTPRSDYGASGDSADEESTLILADNLLDNLLNIAATPKGLSLMQLSGAMSECVAYMYSRYTKKLQVSKCEKFGYGVMLTQVAATSPGIEALYNTGFIKALIHNAWSAIECDPDDHKISVPTPYPVDPVDKAAHKPLTSLLNMLSSYQALYQIIGDVHLSQQQSNTFRDLPKTVTELIEKLVMLNNLERGHYLFNLEQSHVFGLRFLNVLCSCLDSMLLLESQYNIRDCLLQCQESNTTEHNDVVIVDVCSIERNHIIARISSVGGVNERVLPPRSLLEGANPYPWPMITSLLLPKEYTVTVGNKSSIKQGGDLSKFLSSTKSWDHDAQWLEGCKKAFIQSLKNKPEIMKASADLLERVVKAHVNVGSDVVFPLLKENEPHTQSPSLLTETQKLGIQLVVKYGSQLKLFKPGNDTETNLAEILKASTGMLSKQQRKISSTLKQLESGYPAMDWFIATIFLVYCGNRERIWKFILKFSSVIHSAYMWMPRLHNSVHLPVNLSSCGIHPLFSTIGHYIEMILHCEVPLVSSAFRLSGYTPSQICQHWLRQCFWNYLNWSDICHYLTLCLIMGIDYQVYMCVAILKHQQRQILYKSQLQELIFFLMEEPILEFRLGDHIEFMQHLETKYRPVILSDIRDLSTP